MTKRIFTLIFVLTISFIGCYAQNWRLMRYEAHFGIGTTNVFGDIGGTMDKNNLYGLKDIKIKETGPSLYLGLRYKLTEKQALKFNLIYGTSTSSDEEARNFDRKFTFRTHLVETSVQYEYYFITDSRTYSVSKLYNRRGMINNYSVLSFYAFGGLGGVFYSPKLTYGGRQPEKGVEFVDGYSKITPVIPIGLGLRINYNKLWSIGFELGRRFTFSDYLDGISTIYSKDNDTYYFATLHLVYKIECDRYGRPLIFGRRKYRPN